MSMPTCPKCNSLAVGDRCGTCGTEIKRPKRDTAIEASGFGGGMDMQGVSAAGLGLDLGASTNVDPATTGNRPIGRTREAAVYLQLQPSEQAVLHAASRILAGFAANGELTKENEAELADRSVRLAARLAVTVERYVQSDDEDW